MFFYRCTHCRRKLRADNQRAGLKDCCLHCGRDTPVPQVVRFPCSSCGRKLKAPDQAAGRKVHCPCCMQQTVIRHTPPVLRGHAALPPRPAAGAASVARGQAPNREGNQAAAAPALSTLLPQVPGYEIRQLLGRGGLGVVYKAVQVGLRRTVALKMILSGPHAGPEHVARFRSEAAAVARLLHPNIIQIYDLGEYDGRPYFSLEYVEGGNLAERLRGTPQPVLKAADLVAILARALHAAHQRGLVHRDLKPANVLLTFEGAPKITNFGLAQQLDPEEGHPHTGPVLGTPPYMAPEQAAGNVRAIGPLTDVYALGAILYELLTGRPPFLGRTPWVTVGQVLAVEPVAPSRLNPEVPRDLETICLKCLEKEPARRYASALDLAEDLERFIRREPILARPVSAPVRRGRRCRRNPTLAQVIAATILVTWLGFAGVTWQWLQTVRARKDQALSQVEALLAADPQAVSHILATLDPVRHWVHPRLREKLAQEALSPAQRNRVRLALLPVEPEQYDCLRAELLGGEPGEVLVLREGLFPYREDLVPFLWQTLDDADAEPPRRFRAAVVLAAYDPDNPRWHGLAPHVVGQLLTANPLHLGTWAEALRPVRRALHASLVEALRERPDQCSAAAAILAEYAAGDPPPNCPGGHVRPAAPRLPQSAALPR